MCPARTLKKGCTLLCVGYETYRYKTYPAPEWTGLDRVLTEWAVL